MSRLYVIALLAVALPSLTAAQTALPLKHAPAPTEPAITARDLETRLYIFADDSMQGREAGTVGDVKATNYIAAEIKRLGLVPAGDSGTYFQTIPLETRTFDETSAFTIAGVPLTAYTDYVALGPQSLDDSSLAVVYGGELADSAHRIAAEQASGKLVVFNVTGGFTSLRALRAGPTMTGAAGVALIALDSFPRQILAFLRRPRAFLDDGQGPPSGPAGFLITRAAAARMFSAPLAQLAPGSPGAAVGAAVRFTVAPVPEPARNVIGIIPGSDRKLRGQYVAIGAHNDHIGLARTVDHDSILIWNHLVRPEGADDAGKQATPEQQGAVDSMLAAFRGAHPSAARADSISNGADDDGSGSVAALVSSRATALTWLPNSSGCCAASDMIVMPPIE